MSFDQTQTNTPKPVAKSGGSKSKINWLSGKLSLRVTLSVFFTIVVVQGLILYYTVQDYKRDQLHELAETGRSSVSPLLNHWNDKGFTHVDPRSVGRLLKTTLVKGFAIYEPKSTLASFVYGEAPYLAPDANDPENYLEALNEEKARYEVSFGPQATQSKQVVVLRMDSAPVQKRVLNNIIQSTLICTLLAALITAVLVYVLGKWLIEPILMLRNNLSGVARDPTTPTAYLTPYNRRDELGSVISSANKLIKQNADNLLRISQQAQDKIYRVAFFDALTDLPNRVHFLKKLDELLAMEEKKHNRLGIFVMDIDHFGDVNNTLGYEAGDKLLRSIADKLSDVLPDALLIARLGEDEFAAIIEMSSSTSQEYIKETTDAVRQVFSDTFVIEGNDIVLEGSMGMALWPNDANRATDLLKKAEIALDQAKSEEKGNFRLYSPVFDQAVQERIQMINDLRIAIEEKHFSLVYQPQFRSTDRTIIGAEALLRWERVDPETGKRTFTGPDKFIPIAEQSGLIVPIGRWVLEEACRFAMECQNQGMKPFRIAVNLSGIQFHRDNVVQLVRDVLARTGLPAHLLELEVTESAVMKDIEQTITLLQQLKNLGVELAIDDFGTGYSSLSYLKRFPVHRLKIDRSFIMNIHEAPEEAAITTTIIQLGHALKMKVIAEGVETEGQVNFLTDHHCDEFQGYFFSKPLQSNDFKTFVKEYMLPEARHA
jgi:diguanylate cyclase (GGDEF)-like protein